MQKFHIKQNSSDQYYWTLVASNGETMAKCSEYHPRKSTVTDAIAWMKKYTSNAEVVDDTE